MQMYGIYYLYCSETIRIDFFFYIYKYIDIWAVYVLFVIYTYAVYFCVR